MKRGELVSLRERRPDLGDELGLSARVVRLLSERGIWTVTDLRVHTRADLEGIAGIGAVSAHEIQAALAARGMRLADPPVFPHRHIATPEERAEPLEALGLSPDTRARLRAAGMVTVGDLLWRTVADIHGVEGVGPEMADEVHVALRLRGLALAVHPRARVTPIPGDPTATLESLYREGYLPLRAWTALKLAGILTVGAVCDRTAEQLLALPDFGRGMLAYVRHGLDRLGFRLRGEGQPGRQT
ncbi:MAG: DNA-directed RNA polymerase subunit alpha C-terminal domain-containing protein [Pseudomonadota bacterium]|nr:DNA-directed RNA polymerase subunit alpha C-terminal domain-containing protein [Pseudomonadota bacterium]